MEHDPEGIAGPIFPLINLESISSFLLRPEHWRWRIGRTRHSFNQIMHPYSTEYAMRLRLLFLLFTITWLFIASFNSATAYFAMALRDVRDPTIQDPSTPYYPSHSKVR